MNDWRYNKQVVYVLTIFLIIISIPILIYLKNKLFSPPSCFDNKQNQGEKGVDCGGPCLPCELKSLIPLKIYKTEFIIYDRYIDIIGFIENPNDNLLLKKMKYYFQIYDENGIPKLKTNIKEIDNIEPGERRYIVELNFPRPNFTISDIKLLVINPDINNWIVAKKSEFPVYFYNEELLEKDNKWRIKTTLFNSSYYNTFNLEIIGMVYNINNQIINLGKTITTLKPNESKDIYITLSDTLYFSKDLKIKIYIQKLK